MTSTVERADWSPLQDISPEGTSLVTTGAATLPWTYAEFEPEYRALRGRAAKFDLAAAGLVDITGDQAYDLLQQALARDLEFVTPEQSLISLLLAENGRPLDIVTAFHVEDGFRLECSVGRAPATLAHLTALRDELGLTAEITLRTDLTLILVEGPQAAEILAEAIEPDLGAVPLGGILELPFAETDIIVSRSGFTGEYGYKLIVPADRAADVWTALAELPAAGHQALEVAMLEVRQPVLHREESEGISALEAGYAWLIDATKDEFLGRDAVLDAFEDGSRSVVMGFAVAGGEPVPAGTPVTADGAEIGVVVHSVYSPGRGDVLGLAKLREDLAAPTVGIEIGGAAGSTLPAPYLIPQSWSSR